MKNLLQLKNLKQRLCLIAALTTLLCASQSALANYYIAGTTDLGLSGLETLFDMGPSNTYTFKTVHDYNTQVLICYENNLQKKCKLNDGSIQGTGTFPISNDDNASACYINGLSADTKYTITISNNLLTLSECKETTYYLLGSSSGENPTNWTTLATSSTLSFNYTTANGNQWFGISETNHPSNRYPSEGKSFNATGCTAEVWDFKDKEWSGQHVVWLNINGVHNVVISYSSDTYYISDGSGPTPSACTYSIKHPWNDGQQSSWSWKTLEYDSTTGNYSITQNYGNAGCDISIDGGSSNTHYALGKGTGKTEIIGTTPLLGDKCIFTFTPASSTCASSGGTVTITKKETTCTYYFRHQWNGSDWTNVKATDNGDGTYTLEKELGSLENGFDVSLTDGQGKYFSPSVITYVNEPAVGDMCRYTYNPVKKDCSEADPSNDSFTVTKILPSTAPTIRMGNQMTENQETKDVNISAYVAQTGCADITKFTVYYSKSTISSTSGSGVSSKEFAQTSPYPGINTLTALTLPASDLSDWNNDDDLYVRITGSNASGESALSDEAHIKYSKCSGLITSVNIVPSSKSVAVGQPVNFSYTVNDGADITSWAWTIGGTEYTTAEVTYNPSENFTADLTVTGACNSLSATQQTYTACNALGDVVLTGCPTGPVAVNQEIQFIAYATNSEAENYKWYVDTQLKASASNTFNFTPTAVDGYEVEVWVTGCPDVTKKASCVISAQNAFVSRDGAVTMTQCKSGNTYNVVTAGETGMFSVKPESLTVTTSSSGASSADIAYDNGIITWKTTGKADGTYEYTIVAHKTGYLDSSSQTLTITYSTSAPTGTVTITSPATGSETTPWERVELTATKDAGVDYIEWTVSPASLVEATNADGTEAYFKGKVPATASKTHTITATAKSANCTSGASTSITIIVNRDQESCD